MVIWYRLLTPCDDDGGDDDGDDDDDDDDDDGDGDDDDIIIKLQECHQSFCLTLCEGNPPIPIKRASMCGESVSMSWPNHAVEG